MHEVFGDIWQFRMNHSESWICITTNGTIKRSGSAVMGAGIAKEAAKLFPDLPARLGQLLQIHGNIPHLFFDHHIITLPTKENWWEHSRLDFVEKNLVLLSERLEIFPPDALIYMVRPGVGYGGLVWTDVKPVVEKIFGADSRITIVEKRDNA